MANVFNYRFFEMGKEFVFFTILMVQGDKTIFTETENKWTFRQATFITSGSSLEKMKEIYLSFLFHLHAINSSGVGKIQMEDSLFSSNCSS